MLQSAPRHDPLVVGQCPVQAEAGLDRLVAFVRLDHLSDGKNGHLRRQSKAFANGVVDHFLKGELVRQTFTESDLGDGVAGGIEALQRGDQRSTLLEGGRELDRQRLLHRTHILTLSRSLLQYFRPPPVARRSSSCLKPGASRRRSGDWLSPEYVH